MIFCFTGLRGLESNQLRQGYEPREQPELLPANLLYDKNSKIAKFDMSLKYRGMRVILFPEHLKLKGFDEKNQSTGLFESVSCRRT